MVGAMVVVVVGTESDGGVAGPEGGDEVIGPVVGGVDGSVLGGATLDVVASPDVGVTVGGADEPTPPELVPVPLGEALAIPPAANIPIEMAHWALICPRPSAGDSRG